MQQKIFKNSLILFREKRKKENSLTSSTKEFTNNTIPAFIPKGKYIKLIFTSKSSNNFKILLVL